MEVMGLMLGEFVDEYTVQVVDVFAMPQSGSDQLRPSSSSSRPFCTDMHMMLAGTGVSVEAVDHVFQTEMLDLLKQTNRSQMSVGWYAHL
jgi:26S proteasome regulatory subunit N11